MSKYLLLLNWIVWKFSNLIIVLIIWYSDNWPPKWIAPRLGLGFESRLGLVLGLGDNQTIAPEENCPLFRVRVWVRVSFGVGGQFSSGAIVLEPNVINILKIFIAIQWNNILILKNFFIIILLINIIIWSSHGRRE